MGPIVRIDGSLRVKVKGIERPIAIFDVGGIAGDYQLYVPQPASALAPGV